MSGYDVVTLGETMVRLSPSGYRRIEQAGELQVEVGGSESNVAVGLARLGLRTLWLSRLTDNALGRLVEQQIRRHGVDTSRVVWTPEDRVGLYFLEEGPRPRGSRVIYDRAGSAFSRMRAEELPEEVFQTARHLHLSGITPALGAGAAATASRALELARGAGATISFDLNYRRIWSPAEAREGCERFMSAADLLFVPLNDAGVLFPELEGAPESVAERLAARYPQALVVMTLGREGALALGAGGTLARQSAFQAEPAGRVGGGDAFAAGFLYRYLTATDDTSRVPEALRWAAATAAIKYTVPGDIPFIERGEIEALMEDEGRAGGLRR